MKGPPPQSAVVVTGKPSRKLPPLRLGGTADAVRRKKNQAEKQHKAEARIRVRIYRDLLALLDIAERLTLDLSGHRDRYGLEWNSLARQIACHYNADLLELIPQLQDKIMSKEGAHGLPKGLYRHLLDFAGECDAFLKAARRIRDAAPDGLESGFMDACERFKQACVEMRQQICIFENERGAGEESFFE
ncbi:MAG: hypothetical protein PHR34_07650 [Kiritimatiellae bacterium]|nr:hypothetical protein [Kiritimatiellia bacterium]